MGILFKFPVRMDASRQRCWEAGPKHKCRAPEGSAQEQGTGILRTGLISTHLSPYQDTDAVQRSLANANPILWDSIASKTVKTKFIYEFVYMVFFFDNLLRPWILLQP